MLTISQDDPVGETAKKLIHDLCLELSERYGAPPSPFSPDEAMVERSVFLVARLGIKSKYDDRLQSETRVRDRAIYPDNIDIYLYPGKMIP
jgi:hypothetical protein